MADILINDIPTAANMAATIAAGQLVEPLPYINAAEVAREFEKRCGNGMQYTTFPNRITDAEKTKLTSKGYSVTLNTVPSADRHGAGDLYIGFQVALNATAAAEAMQITPNEE